MSWVMKSQERSTGIHCIVIVFRKWSSMEEGVGMKLTWGTYDKRMCYGEKKLAAVLLLASCLQGSGGVHSSMSHGCFGNKRETNTILDR